MRCKHFFVNKFFKSLPIDAAPLKPIEIRRFDENLTRYFVSFEQHSDYYNFYNPEEIIENFLNLFSLKFVLKPNLNKAKIKATFSILNFQPPEQNGFLEITDSRIWSTDIHECVYFNDFVRENKERDIKRRIIINGQTGSSWRFKCFNHITIQIIR